MCRCGWEAAEVGGQDDPHPASFVQTGPEAKERIDRTRGHKAGGGTRECREFQLFLVSHTIFCSAHHMTLHFTSSAFYNSTKCSCVLNYDCYASTIQIDHLGKLISKLKTD